MDNLTIYEYIKQKDITPVIKNNLPLSLNEKGNGAIKSKDLTLKDYLIGNIEKLEVSYMEYYRYYAFSGLKNLKYLKFADDITAITSLFRGCDNLEVIQIGDNIKSITEEAFAGNVNLKAAIFTSITPPGLGGLSHYADPFRRSGVDGMDTDGFFYVPDEALQEYKSSWGKYQQKIKPLSELPEEYNIEW